MIDGQPEGAAREASLWARAWAWWKAWRRPRKHFFVNTRVTIFFGLIFMLDIRLIVALLILAATLDSYTFLAGQDRAKGEAKIPFCLSLKPVYFFWVLLIIFSPFFAPLFRDACIDSDGFIVEIFKLSGSKIENAGGLCRYQYSSFVFVLDSILQMSLILSFYFMNFVIQRNVYTMLEYRNLKFHIKSDSDKNENRINFINPFIFIVLGIWHLYLDFGDVYNPSRVPMPYYYWVHIVLYNLYYIFPLLCTWLYFNSYLRWRV